MAPRSAQTSEAAAIQLGKALNDPVKGITQAAARGVTFTESQKELVKAMSRRATRRAPRR